jgi:hypothetical protein
MALRGLRIGNCEPNDSFLELLDLIEDFSRRFTAKVIVPKWRASVDRFLFSDNKKLIEEPWEILETKNAFPRHTKFLLQRRPLVTASPGGNPLTSQAVSHMAGTLTAFNFLRGLISDL